MTRFKKLQVAKAEQVSVALQELHTCAEELPADAGRLQAALDAHDAAMGVKGSWSCAQYVTVFVHLQRTLQKGPAQPVADQGHRGTGAPGATARGKEEVSNAACALGQMSGRRAVIVSGDVQCGV